MDALREIFRPLPLDVLLVLLGVCVAVSVNVGVSGIKPTNEELYSK